MKEIWKRWFGKTTEWKREEMQNQCPKEEKKGVPKIQQTFFHIG